MPLFSIIIPVYNLEAFLYKCVNSVLDQDFKDIEVILVDDGSPDTCPAICDEFALADSRITVIHKPNGGLSDARNVGMQTAKGDYLLFLDGDDYWEGTNCLRNLIDTIRLNKTDIILYGTKDVNLISHTEVISRGNYNIPAIQKNKESAIQSLFETGQFPGSAWVVAIKRNFVIENKIFFKIGIKPEDIDWLINVFVNAKTFDAVNDPFYMYIKNRPGSITSTSDLKSARGVLFTVSKWYPILTKELSYSNRFLLSYLAYQYLTSFIIYSKLNKTDRKILLPLIKNQKDIVQYLYGKKGLFGKISVKLLGIRYSAYLFNFIHQFNDRFPTLKRKFV